MSWADHLSVARKARGDSTPIVHIAAAVPDPLGVEFDDSWGVAEGSPVTIWTETHVYFPVVHDGKEWLAGVPRDPCDIASRHVGGE